MTPYPIRISVFSEDIYGGDDVCGIIWRTENEPPPVRQGDIVLVPCQVYASAMGKVCSIFSGTHDERPAWFVYLTETAAPDDPCAEEWMKRISE